MGRMAGTCLLAVVMISWMSLASAAFNITLLLNAHPSYSKFNELLTSTGVAGEINSRSSLTVLCPNNAVLNAFVATIPGADTGEVADLLRYHVLLQYLDMPELRAIAPGNPTTTTTLLQTTGRTAGNDGTVNIYYDGSVVQVGLPDPMSPPNATIVTNITQMPYNISILQVDQVLVPPGFGTKPPSDSANITAVLEAGQNFKTFLSLLKTTGVDAEFASKQTGAGITVFAPNDAAFGALPAGALAALTPDQAKMTLLSHALPTYYPLGTLSTLRNPNAPTLATTTGGPGTYSLSVSTVKGLVTLSTGVSSGVVSVTLYDTNPTAVFAIDTVLLPAEIFAAGPAPAIAPAPLVPTAAPAPLTPVPALAPAPATPVPAPAPAPLTPAPAPTPVPAPAPAPMVPSPAPVPEIAPGPPAPPEEPVVETPAETPTDSPGSGASVTSLSRAVVAATVFVSFIVML